MPCQNKQEWWWFLQTCEAYFAARGTARPVVVEVGLDRNCQKAHYERLLGAEHIGIDINPEIPGVDILASSGDPYTAELVRRRLAGRPLDLLFIDGDHSYESVKRDYANLAVLEPRLVALHDVVIIPSVRKFWEELIADPANEDALFLTFHNHHSGWIIDKYPFGIGLMMRDPLG